VLRPIVFVSLAMFVAPALHAQTCATGQTFFKNDVLPANPGSAAVSVIQGLCEGEACGCVFDVSSVGPVVKLKSAAVGYVQAGGVNGTQALVNLKVYDGITWVSGIPQLGNEVFDFENATAGSIGVTSSGINTVDLINFDIPIASGKMVITWWMDFNPVGDCQNGYPADFATDYPSGSANCGTHQKNLIYIQGTGWRDPTTYSIGPFALCPNYYAGNWLIRACVEAGGPTVAFCFGDGTLATGCPCSNNGLSGHGCENSAATGGAQLTATGTVSPDTMVLTSSGELPSVLSIFLQGTANLTNGAVFGDGVRCANSSLKRLYTHNASGGVVSAPTGADASITTRSAALGDTIAPGSTRYYQTYYRDPALSFCPTPTGDAWNVSSGIVIHW
jgi:hypothetical protein